MSSRLYVGALLLLATSCCALVAQTPPVAAKFDEFGDVQLSDLAARLDNFTIALQNEPEKKGFVIAYRSRRDLPGLSSSLVAWSRNYLLMRGLPPERVIGVDGGVASCVSQELWLVSQGAAPTPRADAYRSTFEDTESPRKFYEATYYAPGFDFESYSFDISNSFEGFSEALRREPKSVAYLIGYAGYRIEDQSEFNEKGEETRHQQKAIVQPVRVARQRLAKYRMTLSKEYKIPISRIRTIFGGYQDWSVMELWIVPRRRSAPIPTPNRFPKKRR